MGERKHDETFNVHFTHFISFHFNLRQALEIGKFIYVRLKCSSNFLNIYSVLEGLSRNIYFLHETNREEKGNC